MQKKKHSWVTLEKGAHFPDCNGPLIAELSRTHLKQEDRQSHEDEGDDVRYQEGPSTISVTEKAIKLSLSHAKRLFSPVAEIGKPPDVSEANSEAKTGEEELYGVVPAASVLVHRHRRVFTEVVVRDAVLQRVTLGEAGLCL